ncbi:MAG TPA: hypothetical protein VJQ82_09895 [Terriglobales bacterium]|nr:hypothetical protein [Terriglobales bacterium]
MSIPNLVVIEQVGEKVWYSRYIGTRCTNQAHTDVSEILSADYVERYRQDPRAFYRFLGVEVKA